MINPIAGGSFEQIEQIADDFRHLSSIYEFYDYHERSKNVAASHGQNINLEVRR